MRHFCKTTRNYSLHTGKDHRQLPGLGQSPQSPFLPLPEKKHCSFNKSLLQEEKSESTQKSQQESLAMNLIHTLAYPDPSFFLPLCFSLTPLTNGNSATHQFVYESRALPDILPLTLSISLLNQEDGDTTVPQWASPSQAWRADQFLARMGILCPLI